MGYSNNLQWPRVDRARAPCDRLYCGTHGRRQSQVAADCRLGAHWPDPGEEPSRGPIPSREDWYDYVAPDGLSTIVALQDIDDRPGYGAFWGEVQSTVHLALGVLGCVTNGSFRDVDALAPGFQIIGGRIGPSHAHVHIVQMRCEVNIFGMLATHDDVIHADFHGAVVIPASTVKQLPQAIELSCGGRRSF